MIGQGTVGALMITNVMVPSSECSSGIIYTSNIPQHDIRVVQAHVLVTVSVVAGVPTLDSSHETRKVPLHYCWEVPGLSQQ